MNWFKRIVSQKLNWDEAYFQLKKKKGREPSVDEIIERMLDSSDMAPIPEQKIKPHLVSI